MKVFNQGNVVQGHGNRQQLVFDGRSTVARQQYRSAVKVGGVLTTKLVLQAFLNLYRACKVYRLWWKRYVAGYFRVKY